MAQESTVGCLGCSDLPSYEVARAGEGATAHYLHVYFCKNHSCEDKYRGSCGLSKTQALLAWRELNGA